MFFAIIIVLNLSNESIKKNWIHNRINGRINEQDQKKFIKKLMDNNLLTIKAAENVVRVLQPLNVKKNEIDQALKIIQKVCLETN